MRTVKKHDERKHEILETSNRLFLEKGYEKCTINDILKAIGIAKGTFYHYFASKEQVLDEIIEQQINLIIERIELVHHSNEKLDLKLRDTFLAMNIQSLLPKG